MASTTIPIDSTPIEAGIMEEEPATKPLRKFPPPCWTQEETLCLIGAYREKWYALRRGFLRTADWDAVASTVASRCPEASPAKTSAQCRHKMEKLRQRYRAEKQRALSYPYPSGRYFSSWFFFDNMEAMEHGTTPPTYAQKQENRSSDGSEMKSFLDHSILKLKVKAENDANLIADPGLINDVRAKIFNTETIIPNNYSRYLDVDATDQQPEDTPLINFKRKKPINPIDHSPFKYQAKNSPTTFDKYGDDGGLYQEMLQSGLRAKKFGKSETRSDLDEFWGNFSSNGKLKNPSSMTKYWGRLNPDLDSRGMINCNRSKRERSGLEEMAASIKYLSEGFMRMERAKMEMAQEIETVRMEMEMKRNEMFFESQKQIVDAFMKGLFEMKKNKKMKDELEADSARL